jgi:hypothetical protein
MQVLAQSAVQALRSERGCPVHLTRTAIGRQMGHLSVIEQHLDRMPLTRAFLDKTIESREAHARRKLRWATSQFQAEGIIPAAWSLARRAGLRRDLVAVFSADIETAIRSLQTGLVALAQAS